MATTTLSVHIPPEANPETVSALISLLGEDDENEFGSVQELTEFAESQGLSSRTEVQFTATKLGLLDRTREAIRLSPIGVAFNSIKQQVRGDILHFLMYTTWSRADPLGFLPSWSYRAGCEFYWQAQSIQLTDDILNQQVQSMINQADDAFSQMGFEEHQAISFSRKSLTGLLGWLDALIPPVIEERIFTRRSFCPPELLLLAVGYVVRDEDAVTDTDVLLSREKREAICRLCLLEPDALDQALDWMIPIFPNVIEVGTSAGFYGRFVRLHKLPTLADVVR